MGMKKYRVCIQEKRQNNIWAPKSLFISWQSWRRESVCLFPFLVLFGLAAVMSIFRGHSDTFAVLILTGMLLNLQINKTNQSINQSINWSIKQSINQSIDQLINQTNQSINQSNNRPEPSNLYVVLKVNWLPLPRHKTSSARRIPEKKKLTSDFFSGESGPKMANPMQNTWKSAAKIIPTFSRGSHHNLSCKIPSSLRSTSAILDLTDAIPLFRYEKRLQTRCTVRLQSHPQQQFRSTAISLSLHFTINAAYTSQVSTLLHCH